MAASQPERAKPLILVVDDDPSQRLLVQAPLEEAGFETAEAERGAEGIEKAIELMPDLVILDVVMQDMDGFAVCETLRRDRRTLHLPVLMITSLEDEESIDRAYRVGATAFLTKPIHLSLLGYQVKYLLRSSAIETELRAAKLDAEAATRARTEILTNMSHELRTPLNVIIGFCDLLKGEALGPLGHESYREYVENIGEGGAQLLEVLNQVLDYAKLESEPVDLLEEEVDLDQMIGKMLRQFAQEAETAEVALHYRASEPGCRLYADSRKLQQILRHLLKNAVKYTGPGGKVDVTLDRDAAGGLVIRISDTGIGIAAEDLPKVFEAFRQVDSKLSRWYEGTGLGVPLSCILAERHGGTLDIESEPGRGTTVIVAFPADRTVAPKIDAA